MLKSNQSSKTIKSTLENKINEIIKSFYTTYVCAAKNLLLTLLIDDFRFCTNIKHLKEVFSHSLKWDFLKSTKKNINTFPNLVEYLKVHPYLTLMNRSIIYDKYQFEVSESRINHVIQENMAIFDKTKSYEEFQNNFIVESYPFLNDYYMSHEINDTKENIYNKFLDHFNIYEVGGILQTDMWWWCELCKKDMLYLPNSSEFYCDGCFKVKNVLSYDTEATFNDMDMYGFHVHQKHPYKRQSHFNDRLMEFQSQDLSEVDNDVITIIENEIKISRITDRSTITNKWIRDRLKKNKLNSQYNNTFNILKIVGGKIPPPIPQDIQEQLKTMFCMIQEPFMNHKHKYDRRSFLGYMYVLYKLCELLDLKEHLPFINLPKYRNNTQQLDLIWKLICKDLDWKFIETV